MRIAASAAIFGAVLIAASFVPSTGFAADLLVPGTGGHPGQNVRTATNAHKLVSVVIDAGDTAATVASGFTTIDATTATCAKPTCTIAVDISAEAGGQSAAGNLWAACAVVDGSYAAAGCPYIGELPVDGSYTSASARQSIQVSRGSHSVSFQIFVDDAAVAGVFDVQYQVLTP